ncbi:MAG: DUF6265 family protein [Pseudomonadota bacterium]
MRVKLLADGMNNRFVKKARSHAAALTLLLVLSSASFADATYELPTWLVGCWLSADGTGLEAWAQDSDNMLIGFSSIVTENRVSFYEMMSIRLQDDGNLIFTAYPSNQAGGSFPAVAQSERSVTFQNTAYDFPQRIRYRRDQQRLVADIALANADHQVDFDKDSCQN